MTNFPTSLEQFWSLATPNFSLQGPLVSLDTSGGWLDFSGLRVPSVLIANR